jgi:hypothetical protein
MAAPAHIAALQALLAQQQGAHTGLPGGLGDAMTDAQRAVLLTHASRFKCETVRVACTVAPDEPDAHETIHKHRRNPPEPIVLVHYGPWHLFFALFLEMVISGYH